jgi:hypothetical protein
MKADCSEAAADVKDVAFVRNFDLLWVSETIKLVRPKFMAHNISHLIVFAVKKLTGEACMEKEWQFILTITRYTARGLGGGGT